MEIRKLFAGRFKYWIFLSTFVLSCSSQEILVEYPVYPKTPDGRKLQNFIGNIKNVGIAVDKPDVTAWNNIFAGDKTMAEQIPAKVAEIFSEESYFHFIDLSKRASAMDEITLSLTGITQNRLKLGEMLSAEAILYIGYDRPYTTCGTENKIDYAAAAEKAVAFIASVALETNINTGNQPISKPTGVRELLIPLNATLLKVETGETMKAVVTEPTRQFNSAGNRQCPPILGVFDKALEDAARYVKSKLAPKLQKSDVRIFTEAEDPQIKGLLEDGYGEIKGDHPDFERAKTAWDKADSQTFGKNWAVKANLGTYYFSRGNFSKAVQYYNQAISLRGPETDYIREQRKKVEATARDDDSNN